MSSALQSRVLLNTPAVEANGQFAFALAPFQIGVVTLVVRDIAVVSTFYQTVLGLQVIAKTADGERLGVGNTVLLVLQSRPQAHVQSRRDAGLFHTAFLLPSRQDLGSWLRFAAETRVQLQGASDHRVSEAVYLSDPEGNGIEIYADRPVSAWPRRDGAVEMGTDPLDIDGLMKSAAGHPWKGFPAGGIIGHVHLQVGAIATADGFYEKLLGFEIIVQLPTASFFGSGGYHHQLGANIWNSRGARPREAGMTGLAGFELLARDEAVVDETRVRLAQATYASTETAVGLDVLDPWNIVVSLKIRDGGAA